MIILQEQAAMTCRAIVSADCQSTRSFRPKGGAQKGTEAVWTAAGRPQGEGYGYPKSHGGAT
jgi:hypothetical protein